MEINDVKKIVDSLLHFLALFCLFPIRFTVYFTETFITELLQEISESKAFGYSCSEIFFSETHLIEDSAENEYKAEKTNKSFKNTSYIRDSIQKFHVSSCKCNRFDGPLKVDKSL